MRLSALVRKEDKDKGIEIILSTLKGYLKGDVYDFFNEENGEQLHLTFLKDEIGVFYSLATGEFAKQKAIHVKQFLKEFKKKLLKNLTPLIKHEDAIIIKQYDELMKTINKRLEMYV